MNPTKLPREYEPDIAVEVTMACDMKCKGCYAPTYYSDHLGKSIVPSLPPESFRQAVATILTANKMVKVSNLAIRGGEPALHPHIGSILTLLRPLTSFLYLETNGNWILHGKEDLLRLCAELQIIVKISFDSMHSLRAEDMSHICKTLDTLGIEWLIAITETTEAQFEATRNLCPWVPIDKVIFQPKASDQNTLMRPRLGVIHPNGQVASRLSAKLRLSSSIRAADQNSSLKR